MRTSTLDNRGPGPVKIRARDADGMETSNPEAGMTAHLVAYEYGSGSVWGFINARTAEDIIEKVPEVDIYETPPVWMSDGQLRTLRERAVYLADDALDGILHRRTPAA
jgi:hypothetical protein